jgi:hypothetical protein
LIDISLILVTETKTPLLDRKIEEITAGLSGIYSKNLLYAIENNAPVIIEDIAAESICQITTGKT